MGPKATQKKASTGIRDRARSATPETDFANTVLDPPTAERLATPTPPSRGTAVARSRARSSSSSTDEVPDTRRARESTQSQSAGGRDDGTGRQKKKRIRMSKKQIPDYNWTEASTRKLAEFVRDEPQLYDKMQKNWLNVTAKAQLWRKAGELLDPPATGNCSSLFYCVTAPCSQRRLYTVFQKVVHQTGKYYMDLVGNLLLFPAVKELSKSVTKLSQ